MNKKGESSGGSKGSEGAVVEELEATLEQLATAEQSGKRRRTYELCRHFQENWVAKVPWAEPLVGEDGAMTHVCHTVCSKVEGHDKLLKLVAKIDSLWKHAGHKRAKDLTVGKEGVKNGSIITLHVLMSSMIVSFSPSLGTLLWSKWQLL